MTSLPGPTNNHRKKGKFKKLFKKYKKSIYKVTQQTASLLWSTQRHKLGKDWRSNTPALDRCCTTHKRIPTTDKTLKTYNDPGDSQPKLKQRHLLHTRLTLKNENENLMPQYHQLCQSNESV